ncbi:MAG: AtpZ/AtpI family protein [Gemmatimonadota bacterium]|jgi:F0F1-type ATP synthase assembly protein I|nr:AtpZ/AtpI family protein [Gemmatimonadota bacterium]
MVDQKRSETGRGRSPASTGEPGEYLGVGLHLGGSIVLFLFAGQWLDGKLGTEPWFLLAGVFVGAGAGFYSVYRQLVILPRERESEKGKEGKGS